MTLSQGHVCSVVVLVETSTSFEWSVRCVISQWIWQRFHQHIYRWVHSEDCEWPSEVSVTCLFIFKQHKSARTIIDTRPQTSPVPSLSQFSFLILLDRIMMVHHSKTHTHISWRGAVFTLNSGALFLGWGVSGWRTAGGLGGRMSRFGVQMLNMQMNVNEWRDFDMLLTLASGQWGSRGSEVRRTCLNLKAIFVTKTLDTMMMFLDWMRATI